MFIFNYYECILAQALFIVNSLSMYDGICHQSLFLARDRVAR